MSQVTFLIFCIMFCKRTFKGLYPLSLELISNLIYSYSLTLKDCKEFDSWLEIVRSSQPGHQNCFQ